MDLRCECKTDPPQIGRSILEHDPGPTGLLFASLPLEQLTGKSILHIHSGDGGLCFDLAAIAGPRGRVSGVEPNDALREIAEETCSGLTGSLAPVVFLKGSARDLATDWRAVANRLRDRPIADLHEWAAFESFLTHQRSNTPLVPDRSVDLLIADAVLPWLDGEHKRRALSEAARVLTGTGSALFIDRVRPDYAADEAGAIDDPDIPELSRAEFFLLLSDAQFDRVEVLDKRADGGAWRITVLAARGNSLDSQSSGSRVIDLLPDPSRPAVRATTCCGPGESC